MGYLVGEVGEEGVMKRKGGAGDDWFVDRFVSMWQRWEIRHLAGTLGWIGRFRGLCFFGWSCWIGGVEWR